MILNAIDYGPARPRLAVIAAVNLMGCALLLLLPAWITPVHLTRKGTRCPPSHTSDFIPLKWALAR